ncbi:hypothetical protein [Actinomadura rupiterrae]|uniref:hypothetical protein n=1 Tax=Actinomadura rupiterrae TaxID=559627 RepID=UPI0020A610F3|nr:hypothetical protein [Actinomadura rupiterrae]MCP2341520.1 hypothetical protein [Actinomadura rupiterrae]
MATDELRDALIELEDAMGIHRPIGAAQLPDAIRFLRVLTSLRDLLCPRLDELVKAADSDAGDLAAVLTDTIITAVGKVPVPAATVARAVVSIGVGRFCANPAVLVEVGVAVENSAPPE